MNKNDALYVRIDSYHYWETGNMVIISRAPVSEEQILDVVGLAPKGGFSITREKDLVDCFRKIKGKMGHLLAYLIENRDANNVIPYDLKEIKEATGLTEQSIIANLRYFEKCGIIARKRKRLMLASGIVHRGNRLKEGKLIQNFQKMQGKDGKKDGDNNTEESEDTE